MLWYGAHLGSAGEGGDRSRLMRELDDLRQLGVRNVRVCAGSQGSDESPYRPQPSTQTAVHEYNREMLEGLDFLLLQLSKRGMVAIVMLNNFMPWSGGMAQYVAWAQGTTVPYSMGEGSRRPDSYFKFVQQFYINDEAMTASYDFAELVVKRRNVLNGVLYREDPTIMAWELANAPRAMSMSHEYRNWVRRFSAKVKSWDTNHLVTVGSEGTMATGKMPSGSDFKVAHAIPEVDYATIQLWPNEWGWYASDNLPPHSLPEAVFKCKGYLDEHTKVAEALGKPLVVDALGLVRDGGSVRPEAETSHRDEFLKDLFYEVLLYAKKGRGIGGVSFWGWSGEGRPTSERTDHRWLRGDQLTGDPPDQPQGRFSVFDQDASTRDIIQDYANQINVPKETPATQEESM